jgi:hypothetical protein
MVMGGNFRLLDRGVYRGFAILAKKRGPGCISLFESRQRLLVFA